MTRRGFKPTSNRSSPLKWTKMLAQSSLDDFSYETVVLTTGGLLLLVQDLSSSNFPTFHPAEGTGYSYSGGLPGG